MTDDRPIRVWMELLGNGYLLSTDGDAKLVGCQPAAVGDHVYRLMGESLLENKAKLKKALKKEGGCRAWGGRDRERETR